VHTGKFGLDARDRLERLDGVSTQVIVARGQGKRQRVEDEVLGRKAVSLRGDVVETVSDLHLPLDVAGLSSFVDKEADDRSTVLLGQ
jgi:hypothetical protein